MSNNQLATGLCELLNANPSVFPLSVAEMFAQDQRTEVVNMSLIPTSGLKKINPKAEIPDGVEETFNVYLANKVDIVVYFYGKENIWKPKALKQGHPHGGGQGRQDEQGL